jgi:hypothetical protein
MMIEALYWLRIHQRQQTASAASSIPKAVNAQEHNGHQDLHGYKPPREYGGAASKDLASPQLQADGVQAGG